MLSILHDIHVCRLDLLSSIVLEYMSESMNILFAWEYTREYEYFAYMRVHKRVWIFCLHESTQESMNILFTWEYTREYEYFAYTRVHKRVWLYFLHRSAHESEYFA